MNRIELIQSIFQKTNFQTYLEIGCEAGKSFLPIKAKYKTAVDPFFQIPLKRKARWIIQVPKNLNNKYFTEESDTFFLTRTGYLETLGQLDIVLVDGLHTFQASLNDVLNSLKYLNKDGIIIMHDCYPPNKAAALPTKTYPKPEDLVGVEGFTDQWYGDVWKTIVYLRRNLSELLDVCVIDTDCGLGIVRPKAPLAKSDLVVDEKSFSAIDRLTYDDLIQDIRSMLNLKNADHASTVIKEIVNNNKKVLST